MINLGMILASFSSLKDKSMKLVFETQEPIAYEGDTLEQLLKMQGDFVQVAIIKQEQPIQESEIPKIEVSMPKKEIKSNSQHLRSILYVLWEKAKPDVTFDIYYDKYMKLRIAAVKKEVDKYE